MLATANTFGRNIIRQAGYVGESGDWKGYAFWLGQPHRLRLWGELVSNSMMVIKGFLIYCKQEMTSEPWDDESHGEESIGAGNFEESDGGEAAPAQMADVRDVTESNNIFANIDDEAEGYSQQHYWREEGRVMGAVLDPDRLRELGDEWKEQCAVCKVKGKIARGHRHWSDCRDKHGGTEKIAEAIRILEAVQFANFAHCKWCYRSQAVCEIWARSVNWQGRVMFKKKPGVDCKYGRWVLEAAAAFLAFVTEGGLEEWRQQDPSLAKLKQEMGAKHRRGEVEFSGLFMYFYTWA
jgi:hypothetical protein